MNEKGFGLKEFIIILAVIFICIIVIVTIYKSIVPKADVTVDTEEEVEKQTENVTYQELEYKLKRAAERYQNDNYSGNSSETAIWELSYSMLKEKDYIDKLVDPKDKNIECTGYVEFIQDKANVSYKPYLKCGTNYETEGYNNNNINVSD